MGGIFTNLPLQAFEALYGLLEPEDRAVLACCSKRLHQLCASPSSALWQAVEVHVPGDKALDLARWLGSKQGSLQQLAVVVTGMADGYMAGFTVKDWLAELSASCASSHMTSLKLSVFEAVNHHGAWDAEEVPGSSLVLPQLHELSLSCNPYCPLDINPCFTQLTGLTSLEMSGSCHLAGNLQLPPSLRHLAYPMEVGVGPFGWDYGLKLARGLRSLHLHCQWMAGMEDWAEEHDMSDQAELHVGILGDMAPQLEELGIHLSSVADAGEYLDLAGAEALSTTLRSLQLTAIRPRNARFLKGLSALTRLSLHKCQQLPGLPEALSQLKALRELSVEQCNSVASLTTLQPLAQLSSLSLKACNLEALTVQELQRLTGLKALDLSYSKLPALALLGGSPSSHLVQLGLDVSQAAGLAAALPSLAGLTRLDLQLCFPTGAHMEEEEMTATASGPHAPPRTQAAHANATSAGSCDSDNSNEGSGSEEEEEDEEDWDSRPLRRRPHTRALPSARLFPNAATMLGHVMEAALRMPALRQVCAHCDRAAQRGLDWLYSSQHLQKVVKARSVEVVFDSGAGL